MEHHSNGTQRRQISLQKYIIRITTEGGFKTVTFSSEILSEYEISEMVTKCITRTFKEDRSMLTVWPEITKRDYPGQQYLLDMIAIPCQLSIAKINKGGWIMTDN